MYIGTGLAWDSLISRPNDIASWVLILQVDAYVLRKELHLIEQVVEFISREIQTQQMGGPGFFYLQGFVQDIGGVPHQVDLLVGSLALFLESGSR